MSCLDPAKKRKFSESCETAFFSSSFFCHQEWPQTAIVILVTTNTNHHSGYHKHQSSFWLPQTPIVILVTTNTNCHGGYSTSVMHYQEPFISLVILAHTAHTQVRQELASPHKCWLVRTSKQWSCDNQEPSPGRWIHSLVHVKPPPVALVQDLPPTVRLDSSHFTSGTYRCQYISFEGVTANTANSYSKLWQIQQTVTARVTASYGKSHK